MAYAYPNSSSRTDTRVGIMQSDAHAGVGDRLVRLLWMTEFMARRPILRLSDCRRHWGISLRTFRRDLARLRDAGFIIDPAEGTTGTDPAVRKIGWHSPG